MKNSFKPLEEPEIEEIDLSIFDEPSEPDEDDIIISDNGVTCAGKIITNAVEWDDQCEAIKAWMQENKFYPSVWMLSDHGNYHLTSID